MFKLEQPRPLVYSDKMSNYEFVKLYFPPEKKPRPSEKNAS